MTGRKPLFLLMTIALMLGSPVHARASDSVRVAMIFNFLRYVDVQKTGSRIVLCAEAEDPLAASLNKLSGKAIGSDYLQVKLVSRLSGDLSECSALYSGKGPPPAVGRGQISIGEGIDFVKRGGTIGLIEFGDQLRFAVNQGTARGSGVTMRSQLLRLAANIIA